MNLSLLLKARDALVTLLAEQDCLQNYEVRGVLVAEIDHTALAQKPLCLVGPAGMTRARIARGVSQWQVRLDIALARHASPEGNRTQQAADEQMLTAQRICTLIEETPLDTDMQIHLETVDVGTLYVPERLVENRSLITAINTAYRVTENIRTTQV